MYVLAIHRRLCESVVLSEQTISPLAAASVSAQRHSLAAHPQQVLMDAATPPTPAAEAAAAAAAPDQVDAAPLPAILLLWLLLFGTVL
jgi:hypothetical protein